MTHWRILLPLALLAACSVPPEDRCFAEATRELSSVISLIAEAEQAANRGYRSLEQTFSEIDVTECSVVLEDREICTTQYDSTRSVDIAIDPAAERRAAEALRARLPALKAEARGAYDACMVNVQAL